MTPGARWQKRTRAAALVDERGAAIVEFAIVVVVFLTIVFGIIDGGLLIRANTLTRDAADDAVRRGAIATTSDQADFEILNQVLATGVQSSATIKHVVIYRVRDGQDGPSDPCRAGIAVPQECNVYTAAELTTPAGAFGCTSFALDGSWCPTTRLDDSLELGVLIEVDYNSLTGMFKDVGVVSTSEMPFERRS